MSGPTQPDRAPRRIQLRRTAGWRKPEGAIVVARPSKWGNPFKVGDVASARFPDGKTREVTIWPDLAVVLYRQAIELDLIEITARVARDELAGRDLACWCPLDQPCHADVLLEIANA